jgi:hypothetical protein
MTAASLRFGMLIVVMLFADGLCLAVTIADLDIITRVDEKLSKEQWFSTFERQVEHRDLRQNMIGCAQAAIWATESDFSSQYVAMFAASLALMFAA